MSSFAFKTFEIIETGVIHSFTNRYKRSAMVKRMSNRCIHRYIKNAFAIANKGGA